MLEGKVCWLVCALGRIYLRFHRVELTDISARLVCLVTQGYFHTQCDFVCSLSCVAVRSS